MSCSEPFIAIPIPGPFIHLGHIPLSLLYASSICFDYYICCCTSIPYHKYKHCLTIFHLLLPLIAEPINTAWTTVYIAYPWFLATVGIYVSRIHNKQHLSAQDWLKLIIVEGLGDKNQVENVQLDSIRKIVNVLCGLAFSRFFLKHFLPVNPQLLCEYPWYSFESVYLCLLMGFKGYILMNCSSLGTAAIQAISGIKTVEVFNQPFLATSLQDFWGRRWNLIVRNLFFKQVYHHPSTVTSKNQWGRWRAFFISAVMHEIIMTLVNRHITLENFGFFMIQATGVCMQRYFSLNLSKPFDQCLTLLYIALSGKLFLLPFIRSSKLSIVFGKYFFV